MTRIFLAISAALAVTGPALAEQSTSEFLYYQNKAFNDSMDKLHSFREDTSLSPRSEHLREYDRQTRD